MSKPYPDSVPLKHSKCPSCGQPFDGELRHSDTVVKAHCRRPGCTYSVDLYFIGAATVSAN